MTRLLSGLALAAAALAAIIFLPPDALRLLAVAIATLATHEYIGIARRTGNRKPAPRTGVPEHGTTEPEPGTGNREPGTGPTPWVAYALVIAACWWISVPGRAPMGHLVIGALGLLLVDVLFAGRSLPDAATSLAAPIYIGVPLGTLVAVHALGGREAVLLLLFTVVVSDSAQYYTGRMLGRRPLAPAISPKKTIEGAAGGVVFGTLFMVFAGGVVLPFASRTMLVVMGISIVLLGIAGDLFESKLKRTAGMKDSSALIPGHGGVLDRIDALLFATPAFYLFLNELM